MKRKFLIFVLLLTCQNTFAQSSWSIGIVLSPAMTIPQTDLGLPSPKVRFGYSFGIGGLHHLTQNLFVRSGMNYTRKSLLLAKDVLDTRFAFDPTTGRIDPNRIGKADISAVYQSVVFPVIVNYRFSEEEQTAFIVFGGFELGYMFQRKSITDSSVGGETVDNISETKFVGSLTAGIGLFQPLSSSLVLIVFPKYSYDFYPSIGNDKLAFHTISLGAEIYISI